MTTRGYYGSELQENLPGIKTDGNPKNKVCLLIREMKLVIEYHTPLACPDSSPSRILIVKQ